MPSTGHAAVSPGRGLPDPSRDPSRRPRGRRGASQGRGGTRARRSRRSRAVASRPSRPRHLGKRPAVAEHDADTASSGRVSSTRTRISTRAISRRAGAIPMARSWARSRPSWRTARRTGRASDVAARMDFALRCAYAHGTVAIRTHLDSRYDQTASPGPSSARCARNGPAASRCRRSPLFSIDLALDKGHMADITAMVGRRPNHRRLGHLCLPGASDRPRRDVPARIRKGWNLDFHVDETLDPSAASLRLIAEQALRIRLPGQHPRWPLLLALGPARRR